MKEKRHGASWWLFIGWWWRPCKWLFYTVPYSLLNVLAKHPKNNAQPLQAPQATVTPHTTSTPKKELTEKPQHDDSKVKTYKVAGISHYMENIKALGVENDNYLLSHTELSECGLTYERIYKTEYFINKVELVPEPDNPHDSNAIKVLCDDLHIGYIKAGSCAHVHKLLKDSRIVKISAELSGGPYKILLEDDIDADGDSIYRLEKDTAPHHAKIYITEK